MTVPTAAAELHIPTLLPGSTLGSIHRIHPLQGALAAIPEWRQAMEALTHLERIRPERRNYAGVEVEMEALLAEVVEQRKPLDVDAALEHARAAAENLTAQQALHRGFEATAASYVQRADEAVRSHEADLYQALTAAVTDVVERARQVAPAVTLDAEQAIDAGLVEEWQSVTGLRAEFRSVCAARSVLRERLGSVEPGVPVIPELWFIANPADAEVFEHWRAWRVDGALVNRQNIADRRPLRSPWPDHRSGLNASDLLNAWFDYLARTPQAQPWMPSPAEYATAARELAEYATGLRTKRPAARVWQPPEPEYRENNRTARRKVVVR